MCYEVLSKIFYKDAENYNDRYLQRFENEFSIKLPISIHEHTAFFTVPLEMVNKIADIYKVNEQINALLYNLPTIAINFLMNKALKDEITLTNEIEGVRSTQKEIEFAVSSQSDHKHARFKGLAAKYIKLIKNAEVPLNTCLDIRRIFNDIISDEIADKDKPDGLCFRKEMVHIVSATQKEKHRGVKSEERLIENIDICLHFIKDDSINMLIKIAVFHYLFGYIHPFYDGNGRTSRFISSCLLKDELGIIVSLRLSYVIKNNLKLYYKSFDICNDVKNKGEVTSFILMFLDLLVEAERDLYYRLYELGNKLNYYRSVIEKIGFKKKKEVLLYVLCQNALFEDTFITLEDLVKELSLSNTAMRALLKELDGEGLLLKEKSSKKLAYSANLEVLESMNSK